MQLLFANNAQTTLSGSISDSALTANLASGGGAQFPNPGLNTQYFVGTFTDAATGLLNEIVWVTQRVGDTITMVRGQEGTDPLAWAANDLFANLCTAGQLGTMVQEADAQAQPWNWAEDSGAVNAYVCTLDPALSDHIPGMPIRLLVGNSNTTASTFNPGPGAVAIKRRDGSALIGGEMEEGSYAELIFQEDGAFYILSGIFPATDAAITAGTDTQSAVTPAQLAEAIGGTKVFSGQCRLNYTSATVLTLAPYNGGIVPVAGENVQLAAAGVTLGVTGITIQGSGGQSVANNTVYLVAFNGTQLELWTLATGHEPDDTTGNIGVEVITGHETKTLVGMVRTNGSGQYSDFLTLSWFNRKKKVNRVSTAANRTTTSTSYVEMNADFRNSFLTWAGAQVDWRIMGEAGGGNSLVFVAVGFDGTTPEVSNSASNGEGSSIGLADFKMDLSEGYHYSTVLGGVNAGTLTLYAPPNAIGGAGYVATYNIISVEG